MANSPFAFKKRLIGPRTPSNSPGLKQIKHFNKSSSNSSYLSIETVLGSTTSTSCGFDCLPSFKHFVYCAASSVVLGKVEDDFSISRRYFRANPATKSVNPSISFYQGPTPVATPEGRGRSLASAKTVNGATPLPIYLGGDRSEGSNSRTWTSRDRIKASTSVSLSPDGKFLAVGETGYCPRVLIFSLEFSSNIPLSIITEHSFGVRALAFSPDSQYLATLGDMNDGFLFVWLINSKNGSARLHSTNKCTSTIHAMTWVGSNLVTVGTRHVKVWRIADGSISPSKSQRLGIEGSVNLSSPSPKALIGRNCLLGSLADSVFTCISQLSAREAVVCTDKGSLCVLDDSDGNQKLTMITTMDFGIISVVCDADSKDIWLGCHDGRTRSCSLEGLKGTITPRAEQRDAEVTPSPRTGKRDGIVGLGLIAGHLITLDSSRALRIQKAQTSGISNGEVPNDDVLQAHNQPVLGIGVLSDRSRSHRNADFFTWSSGGQVNFWDLSGCCLDSMEVSVEQVSTTVDEVCNELRVLRVSDDIDFFVSGDRYGVVKLMIGTPASSRHEVRAHGGEVTDIAIQINPGSDPLIASCSRDRMVQVFSKVDDSLELIQTLEDHVGAVSHVLFASEGERLLSCSGDRTVMVREKVTREAAGKISIAYFPLQVVTLKASPVSMVLLPEDPDLLLISTIDRNILKYNISDGRHLHSWKASDSESNAVVMSSMNLSNDNSTDHPRILVGVSTTDKSVRIYDYEREDLLCREFGHTEGVSDVVLIEPKVSAHDSSKKTLISTGLDGIVIVWSLTMQAEQDSGQTQTASEEAQTSKELISTKTPLRRVISMTKLAEFQKLDGSPLPITPTRDQSPPRLRRKTSRFTLGPQVPKITPSSTPSLQPSKQSPTTLAERIGRSRLERSPSPPSPKTKTIRAPRPSLDARSRTKSYGNVNEYGTLQNSASQLCKSLRTYRKRLNTSNDFDNFDKVQSAVELSRELELTLKALGRKSDKVRANSESEVKSLTLAHPQPSSTGSQSEDQQPLSIETQIHAETRPDEIVDSPIEQPQAQDPTSDTPPASQSRRASSYSQSPPQIPKRGSSRVPQQSGSVSLQTDTSSSLQEPEIQTENTQADTDNTPRVRDVQVLVRGTPPKSTVALLRAKLEHQGSSSSGSNPKATLIAGRLDPDGEG